MLNEIYRKTVRAPRKRLLNLVDTPVIVLLYHRVTTLPSDPEQLAVTPENFRQQMRHLKENFELVRFEDNWKRLRRPAVAVTFDDGYADNLLEALPILEETGVPATFFVATGGIGTPREFWWDELDGIINAPASHPESFTLDDNGFTVTFPTLTVQQRQQFYDKMVRMMNDADALHRESWLGQIRRWARVPERPADRNRMMTVDELRQLARSPLATIGGHTVSHSRLSSLAPEMQRQEISRCKNHLDGWLGREVTVFSYPFGRRCDYRKETITLCRELGFAKSAANFPGQAHRWTDPYQIPRHLVRDWPLQEFAARLTGFWSR